MADLQQFGINTGESYGITMPKLQYRFRVYLDGFAGAASAADMTQNVVSVTRPSLSHEEIVVDSYNSKAYLAGKHTWDPLTLTLRDDMNNKVTALVAKQLQKQLDHGKQSSPAAGKDYKFKMRIEQLDGADVPNVLETWSIAGAFIQNVNYNENNYATSDVMQITLSIRFDSADIHSGGNVDPAASGGLTSTGSTVNAGTLGDATGN